MNIKGAIFDCDGTLIDSLGFWELFYNMIGERYFGGARFLPTPEDDHAMRTQTVGFLADLMHNKYGLGESEKEIADWCLEIFRWYYREKVPLKDGIRELLAHLHACGIRMCVASAAERDMIELVLSCRGVLHYFDGIVSCTEVGAGKDRPDVFLAAEKFLGVPHGTAWVFEDSVLAIETAKSAGFPVVGCYDKNSFAQDRARHLCDEYIDDGESFAKLIPFIG